MHGSTTATAGCGTKTGVARTSYARARPAAARDAYHYRIYADERGGDRMFNMTWGFYVFGTSHIDHGECPPGSFGGTWFGRSERAEKRVALWSDEAFGPDNVDRDRRNFGNREPFRRERNHIWLNNGLATYVKVP